MFWSKRGRLIMLAVVAVVAGAGLTLLQRRRGEVWHTLRDQD